MENLNNFFGKTIAFLAMMVMFFGVASAQYPSITPGITSPEVIRLRDAIFDVALDNTHVTPFEELRLEASVPAGFTITPSEYTGIYLVASSGHEDFSFTVKADCSDLEPGAHITYTLKTSGGIVLTTNQATIDLNEPELMFTRADDFEAELASSIKTYTRVWAIQQTADHASVENLRIIATCNKTNINIIKAELVKDISGATVIAELTAPAFDNTPSTSYVYNFGAAIFNEIGNEDDLFGLDEIIFIKETYKILTCDDASVTYTFGHGDGTTFCFADEESHTYKTNASVVVPGYSPNIAPATLGGISVTYPMSADDEGIMNYSLYNNSTDPHSILFDARMAVWAGDLARFSFTRAYLVDAAGNNLGFDDLVMTNNTPAGGLAAHPYRWIVSFQNFDELSMAAQYEALGLADVSGDGIWNDLLPESQLYITVHWKFEPDTPAVPGGCITNLSPYTTRNASICYTSSCNTQQRINYSSGFSDLRYSSPISITIAPENIEPLDPVVLRIDERSDASYPLRGWPIDQDDYDHYIIVTLPEGFDYNGGGFQIRTFTCAPEHVVRTVNSDGRVVLTVHIKVGSVTNSGQYYLITMFARDEPSGDGVPAITPESDKTIDIQHGWAWQGEPMTKYSCYSDLPVSYKLIAPYQNMLLSGFEVQRMTFGWNTRNMTERITLDNIASYPLVDRSVAGPFDNVDMTGTIEIDGGFTINSGEHWIIDVNYNSGTSAYFYFPDPDHAVVVALNGTPIFDLEEGDLIISENSGVHTIRIDLTDYISGPLAGLSGGDVLTVTLKTRTVESLPSTYTQLQDFTIQTYLDDGGGAPENYNILTNNFFLVNYARLSSTQLNSSVTFYANQASAYIGGFYNFYGSLNNTQIFPGEFRSNVTITAASWTFNSLVDITSVNTLERSTGEATSDVSKTLTSGQYLVSHAAGKTTVTVNNTTFRDLNAETVSGASIRVANYGYFYCTEDVTFSVHVEGIFYPTSENPTPRIYNNSNAPAGLTRHYYNYHLSAVSPDIYPITNQAEWDIDLTNQSIWAPTDGILPNSWMAFELPSEVDIFSIVLTDGGSITKTYSDFLPYGPTGSGKYWVQLGNLDIKTHQNFTFSCDFTNCVPFEVEVYYGMSRGGYPDDPDVGFLSTSGGNVTDIQLLGKMPSVDAQ